MGKGKSCMEFYGSSSAGLSASIFTLLFQIFQYASANGLRHLLLIIFLGQKLCLSKDC